MEVCECAIDWVECERSDCPRAERIRAIQEAAYERGRELLGDQTICVSVAFPDAGSSTS